MQRYSHQRLIRRNRTLGRWMTFGGLGLSLAAVIISFVAQAYIFVALGLMLAGFLTSQIGTALHNRFGRSPRLDQVIDDSLKGLDERFGVFHYLLGTSHVLLSPAGAIVFVPRLEKGEIYFDSGRCFQVPPRGRLPFGNRRRELKDALSNAERQVKAVGRALQRQMPEREEAPIEALLLFLAEGAQIDVSGAPLLAVHRKKLKSALRGLSRGGGFTAEEIRRLGGRLARD